MPGTRVRPPVGPSINLVPGIHVFHYATDKTDLDGRAFATLKGYGPQAGQVRP